MRRRIFTRILASLFGAILCGTAHANYTHFRLPDIPTKVQGPLILPPSSVQADTPALVTDSQVPGQAIQSPPETDPRIFEIPKGDEAKLNGLSKEQVEKVVTKAIRSKFPKFSGVVAIGRGDLLAEVASGTIDKEKRYTPDTRFLLGSVTKQFTAALVLKEVDRDALHLDTPILNFFPNKEGPPEWAPITISSLLAQTSGLPDYQKFKGIPGKFRNDSDPLLSFIEKDKRMKPRHIGAYNYSNTNYFLLGTILERIHANDGKKLSQLLAEEITNPLNMTKSRMINPWEKAAATLYVDEEPAARNPIRYFAVGNMYSTTSDLFRWVQGLFKDQLVLSPMSFQNMITPHTGDKSGYGYGFHISPAGQGKRIAWHTGHLSGHTALMEHYIEDDLTVIILTNLNNFRVIRFSNELVKSLFAGIPTPLRDHQGGRRSRKTAQVRNNSGSVKVKLTGAKGKPTLAKKATSV